MRIQLVSAPTYDCSRSDCDKQFQQASAAAGSYCSQRCAALDRGECLLKDLRRDHRFCATCFRARKDVYRPDAADVPALREKAAVVRDAFIGFEDLTAAAAYGDYGVECECGAVGHDHVFETLREQHPWPLHLAAAVVYLREEGRFDHQLDVEEFRRALEAGAELPLALGWALDEAAVPA